MSNTLNKVDKAVQEPDLKSLPLKEMEKRFEVTPQGLTEEEVGRRLEQYGYNELAEKHVNPILKFLSYFWGPIPWMIEAAAILSAVVGHWEDFIIIIVLLLMNVVVGFWEEYQAGNAIEALKSNLALKARVKRDNEWKVVPARTLVPGDLIRLRLGDVIPADAKLYEGDPVQVDQSALTGESLPVTRQSGEVLYSGSIIKQGEGDALVFATGGNTFFGHTARLVDAAHSVSHFQKAILRIGNYLIVIALALVTIILAVALYRGDSLVTTLEFALILTVAAVPVAMPAVLSITMAIGARKLASRKAIVTRLASIEEIAGVDIICSDKTGTLTKNNLTVSDPFFIESYTANDVIMAAALSSRAEDQDSIDSAVLSALKDKSTLASYKVNKFIPFDPVHKRSEANVTGPDGKTFKVTKGAPQVILNLSENVKEVEEQVNKEIEEFASRGYRSLGVARADDSGNWQFMGILPLFDPPRDDAAETIQKAKDLGVKVKVVTGDQLAIAREIARKIGLGTNVQDAAEFSDSYNPEDTEERKRIEEADGYAQVFPEHKYRIVNALQKLGHIVGMTGDGVNDAPALKQADAGIAVSGATDAARAAAAIVLTSPGLSVIVDAILISRKIFHRMTSYAIYRIAETIRVLMFMTLSILIFNFYPVTAVMIVLLALLNDGPILTIAYDRAKSSSRPVAWRMSEVLRISTVLGILGVIASFGLFFLGEEVFHLDRAFLQSLMFLKLTVAGHLTIFITRTRGPFWSSRPAASLLWATISTKLLATLVAVYGLYMNAIGWKWALIVWGYSLAWFIINDFVKVAYYRFTGASTNKMAPDVAPSKENDDL
jgi:H+-transporting ATPase